MKALPHVVIATLSRSLTMTVALSMSLSAQGTPGGRSGVTLAGSARGTHTEGDSSAFADSIVAATREFKSTGVARTINEGNFLMFPFGHSQPTVTCARLRACVIELQPGEIVLSRIAGDLERWEIAPAPSGADGRTTLVVVKPKDCELTTNLVLATDRRIYDLTLDSPPCSKAVVGRTTTNPRDPYVRHVRFYYPDETIAQWAKPPKPADPILAADITQLNFNYDVRRDKKFPWQPNQVFDDGAHVYIKLPPEALHAAAPALFVVAEDGTRSVVNYSVLGDTYVTDRLFDRGLLVSGVDGKLQAVTIERRVKK
ncbi:MAG TPA: TrbG/VirB9 family P-type conjugative transfer protein [Gemmatimonadaceae bacterium]|jgi:type IV secretion system protein VirB9